ncbi:MAG: hypothetical protein ACLGI9_11335 [Thermoanaerobaculia bacterium]
MTPEQLEEIKKRQKQAEEITKGVRLEWDVKPGGGDHLALSYSVRHEGEAAVYLLDRVVVFAPKEGFEEAPDRIIALAEDDPETLTLSRGWVRPPWSNVMYELMPGARRLEPGGTLQGHAQIPLPLQPWHPNEGARPFDAPPRKMVLRMGLLPTFCELQELRLNEGSTVQVPKGADAYLYQQWLTSEPRPIPG